MMVGLKPETIMEVCQRGLSFWSYQIAHQINGLESYANSIKEQKNQLEQLYKHLISRAETTVTGWCWWSLTEIWFSDVLSIEMRDVWI